MDLLTTGIDVPTIENIAFIRRGQQPHPRRANAGSGDPDLALKIGKETFRIFDAVDLYPHLKDLTEMKPVVVKTDISLEQLFEEFARLEDAAHRDLVREQILIKMRRRIKTLNDQARALYQAEVGETPEANTPAAVREDPPATVVRHGSSGTACASAAYSIGTRTAVRRY